MTRSSIIAGKTVIVVDIENKVTAGLKKVRSQLFKFTNSLSSLGLDLALFGTGGTAGLGGLLRIFTSFEDALLFLRTKAKGTEQQFDKLVVKIRELGRTTSYTATQVTEAAIQLSQSGFAAPEVTKMLESTLSLARGARVEIETASRILANTLTTFDIDASQSAEIASQFIAAARNGTLDIIDLAEAMKEVQGTFKGLNVSLPDSLTFVTALSKLSLRGTKAGTSLNSAFLNLASNAEKIEHILGVKVADAANNLRDPLTVIDEVLQSIQGRGNVEQASLLRDLFNIRGGRAVTALREMRFELQRLRNEITANKNEALEASTIMDSKFGGAIRRALSAGESLAITLSEVITKGITPLLDMIPGIVQSLETMIKKFPVIILALASVPPLALAAGAGLLTFSYVLGKVAVGVGVLATGISALGKVVHASLMVPFTLAEGSLQALLKSFTSLGLLLGRVYPDRYKKGKKKGQAKPTNLLTKELGLGKLVGSLSAIEKQTDLLGKSINLKLVNAFGKMAVQLNRMDRAINLTKYARLYTNLKRVGVIMGYLTTLTAVNKVLPGATLLGTGRSGPTKRSGIALLAKLIPDIIKEIRRLRVVSTLATGSLAALGKVGRNFAVGFLRPLRVAIANFRFFAAVLALTRTKAQIGFLPKGFFTVLMKGGLRTVFSLSRGIQLLAKVFRVFVNIIRKVDIVRIFFNAARSLLTFGHAVLTVANNIRRFAFSFSGVLFIFDFLYLFGDKIPGIRDALAALGDAFKKTFKEIGKIGTYAGPAMDMIGKGFTEFFAGNFNTAIVNLRLGFSNLAAVIRDQLIAAWRTFLDEISPAVAFAKRAFTSIWELGKLIVTVVGQIIESVGEIGMVMGGVFAGGGGIDVNAIARDSVIAIGAMVAELGKGLLGAIQAGFNIFVEFTKMIQSLSIWLMDSLSGITQSLLILIKGLHDMVLSDANKNHIADILTDVTVDINGARNSIASMLDPIVDAKDAINDSIDKKKNIITKGFDAFADKIHSVFNEDTAKDMADQATAARGKGNSNMVQGMFARALGSTKDVTAALFGQEPLLPKLFDTIGNSTKMTGMGHSYLEAGKQVAESITNFMPSGAGVFSAVKDVLIAGAKQEVQNREGLKASRLEFASAMTGSFQSTRNALLKSTSDKNYDKENNDYLRQIATNTEDGARF